MKLLGALEGNLGDESVWTLIILLNKLDEWFKLDWMWIWVVFHLCLFEIKVKLDWNSFIVWACVLVSFVWLLYGPQNWWMYGVLSCMTWSFFLFAALFFLLFVSFCYVCVGMHVCWCLFFLQGVDMVHDDDGDAQGRCGDCSKKHTYFYLFIFFCIIPVILLELIMM